MHAPLANLKLQQGCTKGYNAVPAVLPVLALYLPLVHGKHGCCTRLVAPPLALLGNVPISCNLAQNLSKVICQLTPNASFILST